METEPTNETRINPGHEGVHGRIHRLLWLIQEIRDNPRQSLKGLLDRFGISKSQYYKDRQFLNELGFTVDYHSVRRFSIVEDKLAPSLGLPVSDRILLMFALRHLSSTGEGHLVARALGIGRKLASGLDEPFRRQILEAFDQTVIKDGYGCIPEVLHSIEEGIRERRRLRILYMSATDWKETWREVVPKRLYFVQRALYLYAHAIGAKPPYRVYRVSRIHRVESSYETFPSEMGDPTDGGFHKKLENAFAHFMGDEAHKVVVRFMGDMVPFIKETMWHSSQTVTKETSESILFQVMVSEPREVLWWALQFAEKAEVLEPLWLRDEAAKITQAMAKVYVKQQGS